MSNIFKPKNKINLVSVLISFLPVIIIMGVIFSFSAQPATVSTQTSGGFVSELMAFIENTFGPISEDAYEAVRHTATLIVRKSAHFLEFAALGFFLEIHLRTFLRKKTWIFSFIISVIYACSDEFHQFFVAERAPGFADVCVDSLGALCAVMGVSLIILIYKKLKLKSEGRREIEKT